MRGETRDERLLHVLTRVSRAGRCMHALPVTRPHLGHVWDRGSLSRFGHLVFVGVLRVWVALSAPLLLVCVDPVLISISYSRWQLVRGETVHPDAH